MAATGQVRTMVTAQPFRPFTVKLAGGRVFTVRHPENVACSTNGREMALFDDEGMQLLEMLLVELIEPAAAPSQSSTEGNGP